MKHDINEQCNFIDGAIEKLQELNTPRVLWRRRKTEIVMDKEHLQMLSDIRESLAITKMVLNVQRMEVCHG